MRQTREISKETGSCDRERSVADKNSCCVCDTRPYTMVRSSGQHKCALIFCGSLLILLGAGITASGFVYDFHEPYEDLLRSESAYYFTHTQYWLGIPVS